MKKKYIAGFICGALILTSAGFVHAENFEGRENEMNHKCTVIKDTKTQEECRQYKDYLEKKSNDMDKQISNIKSQIDSAQGDADKIRSVMQKNQKEINDYEEQIANIQTVINTTNTSIQNMNMQIQNKTKDVAARDKEMKERLIEMQPYIGSNNYIDFLMGATSFTDLLRRGEIVGELNSYDNDQIKVLNKEKQKLSSDKSIVEQQKELLEVQKKSVNDSKQKVVALNEVKKSLLADVQKHEAELNNQKRTAQMAKANIPKINLDLAANFDKDENNNNNNNNDNSNKPSDGNNNKPSNGEENNNNNNKPSEDPKPVIPPSNNSSFLMPLAPGTWQYSAGTWKYPGPGGGGHMGMDFATYNRTGVPVVAPADGIIIWSYNGGCDNNGFSWCGIPGGGGNNTLLLTKKGSTIYAMPFYHLTRATHNTGTQVARGEVIGYSGNSGYSTGPHTHVEVIRVGNMSMSDALTKFNRTGDLTFGTGWDADNPHACGTAPCREKPENYWYN